MCLLGNLRYDTHKSSFCRCWDIEQHHTSHISHWGEIGLQMTYTLYIYHDCCQQLGGERLHSRHFLVTWVAFPWQELGQLLQYWPAVVQGLPWMPVGHIPLVVASQLFLGVDFDILSTVQMHWQCLHQSGEKIVLSNTFSLFIAHCMIQSVGLIGQPLSCSCRNLE